MKIERGTTSAAHCGICGYELAGLGQAGECPECGRAYAEETVWRPRRINWLIETCRMYSPGIFAGFLVVLTMQHEAQSYMGTMATRFTFLLWFAVCVFAPLFVALEIAEKGWPASRRRSVIIVAWIAGMIGSLALLLGWGAVLGFR